MTEDNLRAIFDKKIAAARWLEANGNSRATHAAKMVRYALESALAELLEAFEEPSLPQHSIMCAPAPYLVAIAA